MSNVFAAIPVTLPPAVLAGLRARFPTDAPLRWFDPEDLHLTVAFLGRLPAERLGPVTAVLQQLPRPDFEVRLGGLLCLPSPQRCSALALGLQDDAGLRAYFKRCQAPLRHAAGLEPDPREPLPHLTFARPDRRRLAAGSGARDWAAPFSRASTPLPDTVIRLERLALYGWAEDRTRRQFRILEDGDLSRSRA